MCACVLLFLMTANGRNKMVFAVVGYLRRECTVHPQVMLYGTYESLREAKERCVQLGRRAPDRIGEPVCAKDGYTLWIRELGIGDSKETW